MKKTYFLNMKEVKAGFNLSDYIRRGKHLMYIHVVPRLINRLGNVCILDSVSIPEIAFNLSAVELSTGKPWPNKTISVGMRRSRKAINGILIRTENKLKSFTTESKWKVENMGIITHHIVTYIEDDEFDMVSQDILLNGGFDSWENRCHKAYQNLPPVHVQPKMETLLRTPSDESDDMWEEYPWGNFLRSREERLFLHTIQSARLDTKISMFSRFPSLEHAIHI